MYRRPLIFCPALAFAFALTPLFAQLPLRPPLTNWSAPLYWAPSPAEARQIGIEQRIAHPDASSTGIAQAASIFGMPGPMTFIAITPCRVLDTRGEPYSSLTGAFGPPNLTSGVARSVPMPTSSNCSIPSTAGAYSLNVTVLPNAGGTMESLSVWPVGTSFPGVSTINDPAPGGVLANAAIVVAGTGGAIQVLAIATTNTDLIIDINGYYVAPSDGNENTAVGSGALSVNTSGSSNTAFGDAALNSNTSGSNNTASGWAAMLFNSAGSNNTANGAYALEMNNADDNTATGSRALENNNGGDYNTANGANALSTANTGSWNTADGGLALQSNTSGYYNAASGYYSLIGNTTGFQNTAVGAGALRTNVGGSNNIGVGFNAAINVTSSNSNNIHIGSPGFAADSAVTRLGAEGTQTAAFIAGVYGTTASGGSPVYVSNAGQLGTSPSSRRFKEDITDMGDASSKLLQLRPVNFFYKPEYDDGAHLLQYGLIAEEVEKVYPEMVAHDKDGQAFTVRYQLLAPMLLNEVQRQYARIESQALEIRKQEEVNRLQQERNRELEDRLAAVEALLSRQTQ